MSGSTEIKYFFKRRMNNYIYISGYSSFLVGVGEFVAMCTLGFCNANV